MTAHKKSAAAHASVAEETTPAPASAPNIVVEVRHTFPPDPLAFAQLEERLMSAFGDKIAIISAAVDKAIARVQEDVGNLQAKLDELQARVDEGTATPEELAAYDSVVAKIDALDPTLPDVLPEPTPEPAPIPEPPGPEPGI